jgi:DNA-binding PadR family transcriptional regulator
MSAVDLFLLGFFAKPQRELSDEQLLPLTWSAYDLAHFIQRNDLGELVKVSAPAVYKNLVALARKGYLGVEAKREAGPVEKKTYSITEAGEAYFLDLVRRAPSQLPRYHFDFNAFIVNLDRLPAEEAKAGLDSLKSSLEAKRGRLAEFAEAYSFIPLPGRGIIRQQMALNEAMIAWLEEFAEEYGRTG